MDLNKIMTNMLASSNAKIIPGEVIGNINPYIEWIKWLSYIPEFQRERLQILNSKIVEDISLDELDEIREYKYQTRMLNLLKKYGTSDISKEEYREVYEFMANHSIDDLMLSKLSIEEIRYATEQIKNFSQLSNEELRRKVKEEQKEDNYKKLSMLNSYILHIISRFDFTRNIAKLNSEIEAQTKVNNFMRQKSLYLSANPYKK